MSEKKKKKNLSRWRYLENREQCGAVQNQKLKVGRIEEFWSEIWTPTEWVVLVFTHLWADFKLAKYKKNNNNNKTIFKWIPLL